MTTIEERTALPERVGEGVEAVQERPETANRPASWARRSVLMAGLGLVALPFGAWTTFGSVGSSVEYLRGERLLFDVRHKSIGNLEAGTTRNVTFFASNYAGRPIVISGFRSSCACSAPVGLPMTLHVSQVVPLNISIRARPRASDFVETIQLFYTDGRDSREAQLKVSGRVVESPVQKKAANPEASGDRVQGR